MYLQLCYTHDTPHRTGQALNVVEPEKAAKRGAKYLNSGTLHATYCYIEENPTFSDVSTYF